MPTPSITVTSNTSIQDLKAFADAATGKERLKARENDDGSVTLYQAKHSKPSVWSKIMGDDKRSDAAVKEALSLFKSQFRETDPGGKALDGLAEMLIHAPATPTASHLRLVMDIAAELGDHLPLQDATQRNDVPALEKLLLAPRTEVRLAAQEIAAQMAQGQSPGEMGALADRLAAGLHEGMTHPVVAREYPDAIYSDGAALIGQMRDLVLSQVGGELSEGDDQALTALLSTSFFRACNTAIGGHQVSGDLTTITLGDTIYDRGPKIGTGGFADVYRYDARDGSEPVAVKIPKMELGKVTEGANRALAQEIPAHKVLAQLGEDAILGLKGALRSDDGTFVMVSELASSAGTAMEFAATLKDMVGAETLTEQERLIVALTLAEDMAYGLDAIHAAGLAHLDFKPQNAFIGLDGVVKVADFGTSIQLDGLKMSALSDVDNPKWKDAHVMYQAQADKDAFAAELVPEVAADVLSLRVALYPGQLFPEAQTKVALKEGLPDTAKTAIDKLFSLDGSLAAARTAQRDLDGAAADAYSLGVSIQNLVRGDSKPMEAEPKFTYLIQREMEAFAQRGEDRIGAGGLFSTLGDAGLNELVNRLTAPNPADRPANLVDFMQGMDLPDKALIGSSAARALIRAISSGDAEAIQAARLVAVEAGPQQVAGEA
ncbi:protein kinase domain-containing protein [Roseicyclus amphidinii]|uniref:protein kinase domain-containing protein n=1 Tax=Roseicyclus amphidinii TaxID=3034232 RepID=UPI0024E16D9C|nr:protein kinase [Roseicyclus sp. Amp-Y-6]